MSIDTRSDHDVTDPTFDPAQHALAMVGYHYRVDDYYEIGREKVREYAKAVQDFHPAHWTEDGAAEFGHAGLVAPLTFISLVGTLAQKKLLETIATGYDLSQLLQTDQVIEYYTPMVHGDRIVCDVSLDSFRQIVGRDMMVTKNIVTNQRNELVQITYTTLLIGRSGDADEKIVETATGLLMQGMSTSGPADEPGLDEPGLDETHDPEPQQTYDPPVVVPHRSSPAWKFEDVSVGDELPARTIKLTRGDLVNYAGIAGDGNPVHWSDAFATLINLETVVAHGMLTMGLGAAFVTSWLGDPGAVKDYTVRFTAPVSVHPTTPAELNISGKIKSLDPETHTAVVSVDARFRGKRVLGHRSTATVQLG